MQVRGFLCALRAQGWEVYIYKKYLVVLDTCCQQLRDECKSEGFCVRFGHTVWKCTFIKMHICIGYMLPTIWGVYVS